ncbi:MAG: GNAT family N-acetyltransferase [Candidatus Heimdallarchaeota archaeon]|nr:MAG: GNAT family N-acetyltransferase [Candidatus Heimdallarchaeota archaeon]
MSSINIIQADIDHIQSVSHIYNKSFSKWIKNYGILYGYKNIISNEVKSWLESPKNDIWLSYHKDKPVGIGTLLLKTVLKYYQRQKVRNASVFSYYNNIESINLLPKLGFLHKPLFYDKIFSTTKVFQCDSVLATLDLNKPLPNIVIDKKIVIGPIKKNDITDLIEIFRLCRPDVFGEHPTREDILMWYNSDWAEETIVAELNDTIIGCMEFTSLGVIEIPGVLPSYRRQGIGSAL